MNNYTPAAQARAHFTRERLLEIFTYNPTTGGVTVNATGELIEDRNNHGYLWVWVDGAALLCHRVAWRIVTGEWPAKMVDHIDGDRTNNRWANLREADHSVNAQNQTKAMCTSSSGLLGAHRNNRRHGKPWKSAIEIRGFKRSLGAFDTAEEAHAAYLKAKAVLHPGCALTRAERAFAEAAA